MNEKGLMEQLNAAIKAALELYAADHGSLDVQFDPDADVAVDATYTLDMRLDIYEEEDNG